MIQGGDTLFRQCMSAVDNGMHCRPNIVYIFGEVRSNGERGGICVYKVCMSAVDVTCTILLFTYSRRSS